MSAWILPCTDTTHVAILLSCACLCCDLACQISAHVDHSDHGEHLKHPCKPSWSLVFSPCVQLVVCCEQATSAPKSVAQPVVHDPAQPAVQPPVQQPEANTAAAAAAADGSEGQQQIDILEELQDVDSILDEGEAQLDYADQASDCIVCLLRLCYALCCICDARCAAASCLAAQCVLAVNAHVHQYGCA